MILDLTSQYRGLFYIIIIIMLGFVVGESYYKGAFFVFAGLVVFVDFEVDYFDSFGAVFEVFVFGFGVDFGDELDVGRDVGVRGFDGFGV